MTRGRGSIILRLATASLCLTSLAAAEPAPAASPADHLPPHIRHLTHFGERADWSHDGKKILFLSKIQMGFSGDEPGIGHGIFVLDLAAVH